RFTLALGVWVLLQCVATAFGRAYTDPAHISRYMDIFSIGLLVNILCGYFLIATASKRSALRRLHLAVVVLWLAGNSIGLALLTNNNLQQELPQRDKQMAVLTRNTSILLASNGIFNPLEIRSVQFPYPDPYRLAKI